MMLSIRPKSWVLVCAATGAMFALGGCKALSGLHMPHWHKKDPGKQLCEDYAPYLKAQSVPVLRVGDGLTPPNTRNAVKIPESAAEVHEHTVKEGCLDRPPPFDSGTKAKPATTAKPTHDAPGN
jgi:hypothetical protein